jgi:CheY-like chemotaxis protein
LVRVEDTGTGMSTDTIERMFEPFFTTKDVGKGTGLGLSTVHAIVRGHKGFINVYSELGRGTRFKVYFPAEMSADARDHVMGEQATVPRGNGELILVVDDEEAIRAVTRRTLERYGYRVMMAGNGAEAVAIFAQHQDEIDVVLTDMAMPVMDGPSTIIALRSLKSDVRIIGSSGLNANGNVSKAVDAGVKHFVPKPYTTEAMLRVLKRILVEPAP